MVYKEELVCNICQFIVHDPVTLPCHCVICGDHVREKTLIQCETCGDEFNIPHNGFKANKLMQKILATDGHLSDEEKTLKQSIHEIHLLLERLQNEFVSKRAQIELVCSDHFTELRRRIDIHREEVKQKVDAIALAMIAQTNAKEAKIMQQLVAFSASYMHVDVVKAEARLTLEFRKEKLLLGDVRHLKSEQEAIVKSLEKILEEFETVQQEVTVHTFKENNQVFSSEVFGAFENSRTCKLG